MTKSVSRTEGVKNRIIFADDHFLVRATLRQFLAKLMIDGGTPDVHEYDNLPAVLANAGNDPPPRLILLDLFMPGMEGISGISATRTAFPSTPIVILSGLSDHETILGCFRAGAAGFIPKTTERDEMLAALRLVLSGQRYVPPTFVDQELQPTNDPAISVNNTAPADLTPRELTILKQLADGKKNKEIARSCGLEEVTIKLILRRIYKKIKVANRAGAVAWATKAGVI